MNLETFLKDPQIQTFLEANDLTSVYAHFAYDEKHKITKFFLDNGVNPLDYVDHLIPLMYYSLDIKSIDIPSHIKRIGDGAFHSCDELIEVKLPSNITHIRAYTFRFCSKLRSIEIPENVTFLGKACFEGCSKLQYVKLPKDLCTIEDTVFNMCRSLKKIFIPETVTSIGENVFFGTDTVIHCVEGSYTHKYCEENDMKFKLVNGLNESVESDTLIEDITETANENRQVIEAIRKLLTEQGFEEEKKLNGIAFTQKTKEPIVITSQFYIDTTDLSHEAYINSEDETFDSSYSNKGTEDSIEKAAALFIKAFINVTTADIV